MSVKSINLSVANEKRLEKYSSTFNKSKSEIVNIALQCLDMVIDLDDKNVDDLNLIKFTISSILDA